MLKLKSSDILVCIAGLSALYTCYTANGFWHHLLLNPPEFSFFSRTSRDVTIYLSFYVCMLSSVLMILFDESIVLRILAFLSSFFLAAVLTESYGFQDWFLHPLVMFNLIFFDLSKNDEGRSYRRLCTSVLGSVSCLTAGLLFLQILKGFEPLKALVYKEKWLQLFEIRPGIGWQLLTHMPLATYGLSVLIFIFLLTLTLSLKSRTLSTIYFIGAVAYWLLQKRIVDNNLLGWLLFILPILLSGIWRGATSNQVAIGPSDVSKVETF